MTLVFDIIVTTTADPKAPWDLLFDVLVSVGEVKAHDSSDLKAQLKLDDLLADAEYLEMFILGQLKIDFHASPPNGYMSGGTRFSPANYNCTALYMLTGCTEETTEHAFRWANKKVTWDKRKQMLEASYRQRNCQVLVDQFFLSYEQSCVAAAEDEVKGHVLTRQLLENNMSMARWQHEKWEKALKTAPIFASLESTFQDFGRRVLCQDR
ncbi:hypothetical protein ARMGADRAFT_1032520 [Armillaria gallica]|uniref:Uncharacterized protein n=1 Tax=Armillaria gallica TaxID=47427 RepID=A0A2H3D9P6_ARMGA|nr:hypothetical protein ARMGADRAFT_1032520 [Armillaria gallica]